MARTALATFLLAVVSASIPLHAESNGAYDQYVYLVKASDCLHAPRDRALTGFRLRGLTGIVTALHGVADSGNITVTSVDGKVRSASVRISKVDLKNDVALLTSPEFDRAPADGLDVAANPNVLPNAKAYVVGYPLGTYLEPTKLPFTVGEPPRYELGRKLDVQLREALQQRKSPDPSINVLFLVGPIHPGHSGAPVLDSSSRVIAIANGSIRLAAGYGWAIPFQAITWRTIQGNPDFQTLKSRAPNIALFSFDENPHVVQERISLSLDAIKEDTSRILKLQTLAASKDRLQILRDYVPRIGDNTVRFGERSIALAECINAGVFQGSAAFEKAAELVSQSYTLEEQRIGFPQLVASLVPLAPKYLDFITQECCGELSTPVPSRSIPAERSRASEFWWAVFQQTLAEYPEVTLAAISETRFAANRYSRLDRLCANIPEATLARMEGYPSRSVRGLAAIQRATRSREQERDAMPVIRELVDADGDEDLHLAAELLGLAKRHAIIDPPLAQKALTILKTDGPVVSESLGRSIGEPDRGRGREFRLSAAEEYLVWSVQLEQISRTVGDPLAKVVEGYEVALQSFESTKPDRGNGDLYARACIRALISLNKGMYGVGTRLEKRVSFDEFILLGRVFSHSPEILDAINLAHLKTKWDAAVEGGQYDP